MKTKLIVSIEKAQKKQLEEIAALKGLTLSGLVRVVLNNILNSSGVDINA